MDPCDLLSIIITFLCRSDWFSTIWGILNKIYESFKHTLYMYINGSICSDHYFGTKFICSKHVSAKNMNFFFSHRLLALVYECLPITRRLIWLQAVCYASACFWMLILIFVVNSILPGCTSVVFGCELPQICELWICTQQQLVCHLRLGRRCSTGLSVFTRRSSLISWQAHHGK